MRKKFIWSIGVFTMAVLLTACGNEQSAVNQVMEQGTNEMSISGESVEEAAMKQNDSVQNEDSSTGESNDVSSQEVDVDLTILSSTMVYSEVNNMMTNPDDYEGKTVKMKGAFSVYENEETGMRYFSCVISDATACCSQGIEFELDGDFVYPDDYPELDTEITVIGTFETYMEGEYKYCRLAKAVME